MTIPELSKENFNDFCKNEQMRISDNEFDTIEEGDF